MSPLMIGPLPPSAASAPLALMGALPEVLHRDSPALSLHLLWSLPPGMRFPPPCQGMPLPPSPRILRRGNDPCFPRQCWMPLLWMWNRLLINTHVLSVISGFLICFPTWRAGVWDAGLHRQSRKPVTRKACSDTSEGHGRCQRPTPKAKQPLIHSYPTALPRLDAGSLSSDANPKGTRFLQGLVSPWPD